MTTLLRKITALTLAGLRCWLLLPGVKGESAVQRSRFP
jgi:hypothetical protein